MLIQRSIATQRCWVSLDERGLGERDMSELRLARQSGSSVSAFIHKLNSGKEHVPDGMESGPWDNVDASAPKDESPLYHHSNTSVFASIDYQNGGFKVTNRP